MLFIHPILQWIATLLALYVGWMGMQRFRHRHMGASVSFQWARHVHLGTIVFILWVMGLVGGAVIARMHTGVFMSSGPHATAALAMVPIMGLGFVSGIILHRNKANSSVFAMAHGLCNLVLLLLALFQIVTGAGVLNRMFS